MNETVRSAQCARPITPFPVMDILEAAQRLEARGIEMPERDAKA